MKSARMDDRVVGTGSWASSPGVRRSMQSNRPRNTSIELALRSALHRSGLRFWKHRRPVPGLRCEADILFPRIRLAVFVDGCFWHGCPEHATRPVRNGEWWAAKLDGTISRDRRNDESLAAAGWIVLRVWEHEPITQAADTINGVVAQLGSKRASLPENLA